MFPCDCRKYIELYFINSPFLSKLFVKTIASENIGLMPTKVTAFSLQFGWIHYSHLHLNLAKVSHFRIWRLWPDMGSGNRSCLRRQLKTSKSFLNVPSNFWMRTKVGGVCRGRGGGRGVWNSLISNNLANYCFFKILAYSLKKKKQKKHLFFLNVYGFNDIYMLSSFFHVTILNYCILTAY